METWKEIPSYPKYEASSLGRIRRKGTRKAMKARKVKCASVTYWKINLGWDSVKKEMKSQWVHAAVCEAFHGKRPEGNEVRHLNNDGLDNREDNLKWGTKLMNLYDRFRGRDPGPCECGRLYEDHDEDGQAQTPGPDCIGYRKIGSKVNA